MEEMKEREYDWWISYTYMKYNDETFCNCFKWDEEGLVGGDVGGNLSNLQCKPIQNYHSESPLYNEYMLIKVKKYVRN
jgi:hypothetical protein